MKRKREEEGGKREEGGGRRGRGRQKTKMKHTGDSADLQLQRCDDGERVRLDHLR